MSRLVDVELWIPRPDGTATRRGRSPLGGDGSAEFVRGVTIAGATNTGPRIPDNALVNYAGSFTNATPGETISGLAITGNFDPNADDVKLVDSVIAMGASPLPAGQTYHGLRANRVGVTGITLEHVRIAPSTGSVDHYGAQGWAFTLKRCDVSGVVDAVVAHGNSGFRGGIVEVLDSYLHDLAHYPVDPRQSGGPSHGDCVQAPGGSALRILGSTLEGGFTSAVLVKDDLGYGYPFVTVEDCYLDAGYVGGGSLVNVTGLVPNLTIRRNRFGRTSPSTHRLLISTASRNASTTVIPTSGPDANRYLDDGSVVPITNGG